MTADQIEAAARELCRMRGLDPDAAEKRPHFRADGKIGPKTRSALQWCADEIRTFAQAGTAIASVLAAPAKRVRRKKGETA